MPSSNFCYDYHREYLGKGNIQKNEKYGPEILWMATFPQHLTLIQLMVSEKRRTPYGQQTPSPRHLLC